MTEDEGDVLWEPNCTYDLEPFQIKNAGNLALKYKVTLKATKIDKAADGDTIMLTGDVDLSGETVSVDKDSPSRARTPPFRTLTSRWRTARSLVLTA